MLGGGQWGHVLVLLIDGDQLIIGSHLSLEVPLLAPDLPPLLAVLLLFLALSLPGLFVLLEGPSDRRGIPLQR